MGIALKEHRSQHELRQQDVAIRAGVSLSTVQRLERGHWPTDPLTLDEILIAYAHLAGPPMQFTQLWGAALKQLIESIAATR